jgi:hypothetical protein
MEKENIFQKENKTEKRYTLTLFEVFVLTLVRIIGYDTNHLSFLFGISQSHVPVGTIPTSSLKVVACL